MQSCAFTATVNVSPLDENNYWHITPSRKCALTLHTIDKSTVQWAAENKLKQWNRQQQTKLAIWCAEQGITDKPLLSRIRLHLHYHQQEPWHHINTADPVWQSATQQVKTEQIEQLKEVTHVEFQ